MNPWQCFYRTLLYRQQTHLVELPQDDFLKVVVVHFLTDAVEVFPQHREVQAEVKLCLLVAKGEGALIDCQLGDVAHCAAFRDNGPKE